MNIMALLIQLASGAAGGNLAGALLRQFSLGPAGNSIADIVGGVSGGQLLHMINTTSAGTAASGLDIGSIVSNLLSGRVGGCLLMVIVGIIKSTIAKS